MTGSPSRSVEDLPTPLLTIGVVSDTHGHVYPHIKELLEGVDHIIHAGDVCSPEVLTELRAIAPVTAVRGNCDTEAWAVTLPQRVEIDLAGVRFTVTHIGARVAGRPTGPAPPARSTGPASPARAVAEVAITGHTHVAAVEQRGEVLHLNPGSAGPRRFGRPRTIARVEIFAAPDGSSPPTGAAPVGAARVRAEVITAED